MLARRIAGWSSGSFRRCRFRVDQRLSLGEEGLGVLVAGPGAGGDAAVGVGSRDHECAGLCEGGAGRGAVFNSIGVDKQYGVITINAPSALKDMSCGSTNPRSSISANEQASAGHSLNRKP